MLVVICILIGLGLVVCGAALAGATEADHGASASPHRVNVSTPPSSVNGIPARIDSAPIRPLPPRRPAMPANIGTGPRGIRPDQFPCCPYDKQRNIPGSCQVIFWDRAGGCYRCSRGHRFKSNGKIL